MLSSPRETKGRLRRREVIEAIKVRRGEGRELTKIGRRRARRGRDRRQIVREKDRMTLARRAERARVDGGVLVVRGASEAFPRVLCRAACEAEQAAATAGSAQAE